MLIIKLYIKNKLIDILFFFIILFYYNKVFISGYLFMKRNIKIILALIIIFAIILTAKKKTFQIFSL